MSKLRLQFIAFFLLLQLGIFFLLYNSYRQMRIEEKSLWDAESAKVYNQMQAQVSDLLNVEDARSFRDYRFYQGSGASSSPRSSLADLSEAAYPKGWVGYFQMDPDGSFSTPYLPAAKESLKSDPDYPLRLKKQAEIETTTAAFRKEMKGAFANRSVAQPQARRLPKPAAPALPAGSDTAPVPLAKPKTAPNIYPNPLASKQAAQSLGASGSSKGRLDEADDQAALPALARREEAAPASSIQSFAQAPAPASPPREVEAKKSEAPRAKAKESAPPGAPAEKQYKRQVPSPARDSSPSSSVVWLDPFQAKVSGASFVFFRRVWVEQQMYLQGFAIRIQPFFEGLMQNAFLNSSLPDFSWVRWASEGQPIAQYGRVESDPGKQNVLFSRWMAYPLNGVQWSILGQAWPEISTRFYLNLLSGGLFLFASMGLFWIYRSSAEQVRLSQKRQDFVAAVSHELKTPLTSIRMYSEMLEGDWVGQEEKRQEYYRSIRQESERLSRLIENVLQMARLEKQSYYLSLIRQSPSEDLRRWAAEFSELAAREGFSFRLEAPAEHPAMQYEPEALKEILLILLENSIKFSRQAAKKELKLSIRVQPSWLEWTWMDRGPGVPPRELSQIFDKFYRVENELTRRTKGTGIGLAIAKATVEAMGGTIQARNTESGGLEVFMKFPLG